MSEQTAGRNIKPLCVCVCVGGEHCLGNVNRKNRQKQPPTGVRMSNRNSYRLRKVSLYPLCVYVCVYVCVCVCVSAFVLFEPTLTFIALPGIIIRN